MAKVRVLVGTRKGAFVMTSDERRKDWKVEGPHFAGWEVYHMNGSPADPDRLYASQSRGWFGQVIQRSDDGGKTWQAVGNEFHYDGSVNTHKWYDNSDHPYEFARVWHLEPSLKDPDTVYAGVEDAALFKSTDGAKTWEELPGIRTQKSAASWAPKHWDVMRTDDAGEMWHEISGNLPTDFGFVIDVHSHEPDTVYVIPIKSDSDHFVPDGKLRVYRSRSGGNEWEALTKGLPQKDCYVNVLRDAMAVDSLDSCGVYFGTSGGQVYASADAGDTWNPIVRDLPSVLSVQVQTLE